jgi:hypothetical protein
MPRGSRRGNVEDHCSRSFPNSRALLDPEWIGGPDKSVEKAVGKSVILLRGDGQSSVQAALSAEDAVSVL